MHKAARLASIVVVATISSVPVTEAATFKTIYKFKSPEALPGSIVRGPSGFFYGTTIFGGFNDAGSVFKYNPKTKTYKTLHDFGSGNDGQNPGYTPLNLDNSGNIIGVTYNGGSANLGTIYRIDPSSGTETILYNFPGGVLGSLPTCKLVVDKSGYIYGTTYSGGSAGLGSVFRFDPATLQMSIVYSFPGGKSSQAPGDITVPNAKGIVYGTTYEKPGTYKNRSGIIYSLDLSTGIERILHEFEPDAGDGKYPDLWLQPDGSGRLIGATAEGGSSNGGTVFAYDPASKNYAILYNFTQTDGAYDPGGVGAIDQAGNIYGVTSFGSGAGRCGALWKLSPTNVETTLHSFGGDPCPRNSADPSAILAIDNKGHLFGTTERGAGLGSIFEYKP